ncbi:PREDICTED: S-adenosylmethionine mitochondrial carrier protein isoform X1 [Haliaeetus leucocephalus]|uniref:S-adenosylmethionine mitochondrial carrier protein isoform X1 n=1 Tax=Haliaeetus leucocephalus TaxID=52644 RepID=UPI00053CE952|nr:PREDICTED: S-adenosylmethionine mitochondrial carrier protein isoform X1 [Haliaeetus leucocephalus]
MEPRESWAALAAGGVAGVCVDLILFPLDTVKTRLQSPQGFRKAGGFRGIYAGVPSTAIGSFPNAAAFFITYENVKSMLHHGSTSYLTPATHMVAASLGEVVACLIRVPSEVVKQRAQVSPSSSTLRILSHTLYHEGIQGLYRGYKSTVLREIPFSLVQFPLWESLKDLWSWKQGHVVDSWQSAVCGAFAAEIWQKELPEARLGGNAALPFGGGWGDLTLCAGGDTVSPAEQHGDFQLVCRCCPTDGSHQPGRLHLPGDIREDSPAAALTQPSRSCRWPPKSWRSRRVGGGVRPRTQPSSDRPFAVPQQLFSRLRAAFAVKEK